MVHSDFSSSYRWKLGRLDANGEQGLELWTVQPPQDEGEPQEVFVLSVEIRRPDLNLSLPFTDLKNVLAQTSGSDMWIEPQAEHAPRPTGEDLVQLLLDERRLMIAYEKPPIRMGVHYVAQYRSFARAVLANKENLEARGYVILTIKPTEKLDLPPQQNEGLYEFKETETLLVAKHGKLSDFISLDDVSLIIEALRFNQGPDAIVGSDYVERFKTFFNLPVHELARKIHANPTFETRMQEEEIFVFALLLAGFPPLVWDEYIRGF